MFPEIWRALRAQGISFQWTILGEGSEEAYLRESMAEGVRAGEIVFSPPIFDRQKLSHMIAAHDIFLLCSLHEGLPLALLEAMGHGLVPVCGDVPSLRNGAITPDNGLMVLQNDPHAYARAIASLHRDRPLLERMSAQSLALFERDYTAVAMARRYIDVIEQHRDAHAGAPSWPASFSPQPPFGMEKSWHMASSLLPLRRLFKRLKSLGS
jgi:glycosyltransferase involved in cell wall biosynthesis